MSREKWSEEEAKALFAILMTTPKNIAVVQDALEKVTGFRRTIGALAVKLNSLVALRAFEVTEEMRDDLRKAARGKKKVVVKAAKKEPAPVRPAAEDVMENPPAGWLIISKACSLVGKNQHWVRRRAEKKLIAVRMFNGCMHFKEEDLRAALDTAAAEDQKAKTKAEAFADGGPKNWLLVGDAAKLLKCSRGWIEQSSSRGKIKRLIFENRYYYRRSDVEAMPKPIHGRNHPPQAKAAKAADSANNKPVRILRPAVICPSSVPAPAEPTIAVPAATVRVMVDGKPVDPGTVYYDLNEPGRVKPPTPTNGAAEILNTIDWVSKGLTAGHLTADMAKQIFARLTTK